jgi:hypothetical protein
MIPACRYTRPTRRTERAAPADGGFGGGGGGPSSGFMRGSGVLRFGRSSSGLTPRKPSLPVGPKLDVPQPTGRFYEYTP